DPVGNIELQRTKLDALHQLNDLHKRDRVNDSELDARISSFELAFRMQREAPEAFDLSRESAATHRLYGTDKPATELFGRQCMMARRPVERGVRFIQVVAAPKNNVRAHHTGLWHALPKLCAAAG